MTNIIELLPKSKEKYTIGVGPKTIDNIKIVKDNKSIITGNVSK